MRLRPIRPPARLPSLWQQRPELAPPRRNASAAFRAGATLAGLWTRFPAHPVCGVGTKRGTPCKAPELLPRIDVSITGRTLAVASRPPDARDDAVRRSRGADRRSASLTWKREEKTRKAGSVPQIRAAERWLFDIRIGTVRCGARATISSGCPSRAGRFRPSGPRNSSCGRTHGTATCRRCDTMMSGAIQYSLLRTTTLPLLLAAHRRHRAVDDLLDLDDTGLAVGLITDRHLAHTEKAADQDFQQMPSSRRRGRS